MSEWLRTHVYLASWASPFIALGLALLKSKKQHEPFKTSDFVLYTVIFICLGVVIAPGDIPGRTTCSMLVVMGFVSLMLTKK